MIGIMFEIPNSITNTLYKIFDNTNTLDYYWYVDNKQTEAYDIQDDVFFSREEYNGSAFMTHITQPHKIIFLKIEAYLNSQKHSFRPIHSFTSYVKSDCMMIVLVYDCTNVEIFCKDEHLLMTIIENAKNNNYKNLHVIYKKDREIMDVIY